MNELVALAALLELPLSVALAVSLAYRLAKGTWWRPPRAVVAVAGAFSFTSFLLGVLAFLRGQSPSDIAIFNLLGIGTAFGYLGLIMVARLARRSASRS